MLSPNYGFCSESAAPAIGAVFISQRIPLSSAVSIIEDNGVVSEAVAAAMADGVKKLCSSTYSVATTGLAEGGDDRYPEGTVCIGVSSPSGTFTRIFHTNSDRKGNIRRFANAALNFLEEIIVADLKD